MDKFETTPGGKGCIAVNRGKEAAMGCEWCRNRIEEMIREKQPERYNAAPERLVERLSKKGEKNPRVIRHESSASKKQEGKKEVRSQEGGSSGSGEQHQDEGSGSKRIKEESAGRKAAIESKESDGPMAQSEAHQGNELEATKDSKRAMDVDEFEKTARRRMEEKSQKREREEAERDEKMKVRRTEGESQGIITKTMGVDWISGEKFKERKDELREGRIRSVIIRGKDHKRATQIIEIQSVAGEHYICETPNMRCQEMSKAMTKIGKWASS